MASIGELSESQGEIKIEWKIKDFISLPHEIDTWYGSPKFYFSGASWQIRIYPNGETDDKSEGWIGLGIMRTSTGSGLKLNYSLTLKAIDEKIGSATTSINDFHKNNDGWANYKVVLRSTLEEKLTNVTASNILTVICTLKNFEPYNVTGSLFNRHQTLSDCLNEIYEKKKNTDCSLKIDGENILAHKLILEARSPVFGAMFNHDTKENQTGEISIDDIEEDTMETILMYMYTGDIDTPTIENIFPLYAAAEKYDIKEIKEICTEFIVRNFSEDWVIDVIKFNELYQDEDLGQPAKDYFKKNVRKILKTEKWKTFAKENHDISIELLSSVVTDLVPE